MPVSRPARRRTAGESLQLFFRTPKGLMTWVLPALAVLASLQKGPQAGGELLATLAAAAVCELALNWIQGLRIGFPSGALLTGLFVAMILGRHSPVYVPAAVTGIALFSKHLVRTRWSNIFNPAALGLVVGTRLFASAQSWWGTLPYFGVPGYLVLLAAGLFVTVRLKKLRAAAVYLGVSLALFTAAAFFGAAPHVVQVFRAPDIEMLTFFAFFMLTDPPTSPARPADQTWYAALVAVAGAVLFLQFGVQWFLLGGLLLGNAFESARRLVAARARSASLAARQAGAAAAATARGPASAPRRASARVSAATSSGLGRQER